MTGSVPRKLLSVAEYSSLSGQSESFTLVLLFCFFLSLLFLDTIIKAYNKRKLAAQQGEPIKRSRNGSL